VDKAPAPRRDAPQELARVTFAAVGDVLPHGAVKRSAERWNQKDEKGQSLNHEGWDALFADVAPLLSQADLAFANLETPVSPSGDAGTREFQFNAPRVLLHALQAAGIDLVAFTNNHVYDQGRKGFVETLAELDDVKLPYAGAGRTRAEALKGLRLERNGVRIAVLGASQFFNNKKGETDDPKAPQALKLEDDPREREEAVRAARSEADFVVLSLHWGVEYQPLPREQEVALSQRLFEAGADVILGTHPHVLQPIEVYQAEDGRLCMGVYSLGNFVSNQSRFYAHGVSPEKVGDTRDGAVLQFAVVRRDYGGGLVRTELADVRFRSTWTVNDFLGRKKKALPDIRVVSVSDAIAREREGIALLAARLADKQTKEDEASLVSARKRLELLERRLQIIQTRLGADFSLDEPAAP